MSFIERLERNARNPQFIYENELAVYTGEMRKLTQLREAAAQAWLTSDGQKFLPAVTAATEQAAFVARAKRNMMAALMALPATEPAND